MSDRHGLKLSKAKTSPRLCTFRLSDKGSTPDDFPGTGNWRALDSGFSSDYCT